MRKRSWKHWRCVISCLISSGGRLYIISIMSDTDAENCILHIITLTYSTILLPEFLGCIARRHSIKLKGNTRSESYQFDISSSAVTARPKYSLQAAFSLAWNCQLLKQFIHWINLQPVFHTGQLQLPASVFLFWSSYFYLYAFWVMNNDLLCFENAIL